MKIIPPTHEILSRIDRSALQLVELAGRTCYIDMKLSAVNQDIDRAHEERNR